MQCDTTVQVLNKKETKLIRDSNMDQQENEHNWAGQETAVRQTARELTNIGKIREIEYHFREIMQTLGLDLTDDSLSGTPLRVAKMYVNEIFSGLNHANKPKIALFENKYKYDQMLIEKDISLFSSCEHHFVPFHGKVHVAYISNGNIIGLSKLNRIVQYFAKRPQVQERLTMQIGREMQEILGTDDVAVIVTAKHMCVSSRGIRDTDSSTITSFYDGRFLKEETKSEFLNYLSL